jgi:hypothetical protein
MNILTGSFGDTGYKIINLDSDRGILSIKTSDLNPLASSKSC